MLRHRSARLALGLMLSGIPAGAQAQSPAPPPAPGAAELRLGLAAHDPAGREQGTVDLKLGLLLPLPVLSEARSTGPALRAEIGASLNASGRTSHAHAGLNLAFDLAPRIFVEAGLGLALHDGRTRGHVPADRNAMGCAVHFREAAGIGYRIDRHWSLIASVEHLSNAGLCRRNRGLTSGGLSLGYRF